MSKRIISLDWLRGVAVFGMTAIHVFLNTSELVKYASDDPFSLPPALLIVAAFAVIFSHWRGFFLMISSVVHMYSMTEALKRGKTRGEILKKQLLFGSVFFVFAIIKEGTLNQWGWFGEYLDKGVWDWGRWKFMYFSEALENIAISILLTSLLFYLISAKGGLKKIFRNVLICVILIGCFLFLAPYVHEFSNIISGATAAGEDLQTGEYFWTVFPNWYDYITRLFINQFAGRESPLFPMYSYSLIGVILGLLLTREDFVEKNRQKKFQMWGHIIGILLIGAGVMWWIFIDNFSLDLGFHVHPTWFVLLSMGLQMIFLLIVMGRIEFNPKINKQKVIKRTKHLRRWGILALTVYVLAPVEFIPRVLLNGVGGVNFNERNEATTLPMLGMLLLVMIIWEIIIRLWEKVKFKGTFEWLMLKLAKRGKKIDNDDPLNVQGIFYDVEPVMFVKTDETR